MVNQNNMPGAGSINDTMEFMRKMWGSMGALAIGIPTLSVEEINKKIADLKTVASWLELNMNMLRTTIQTLEVQSATLLTLQAMGAILAPTEGDNKAAGKVSSSFGFPVWPPQTSSAAKSAKGAVKPGPEPEDEPEDEHPGDLASVSGPDAETAAQVKVPLMPTPDFQASMADPNAWWNLLQEQFQQAVGNVMADQVPAERTRAGQASQCRRPEKNNKTQDNS